MVYDLLTGVVLKTTTYTTPAAATGPAGVGIKVSLKIR